MTPYKLAISILLGVATVACATGHDAVTAVGEYRSPSGDCTARIIVSPNGGFRQLLLLQTDRPVSHITDDVTGIAWLSNSELVYTVGPIYGSPGLFLVRCADPTPTSVTLVAPRTYNKAYPNGADFFELKSIAGRRITYYYGQDADAIDFKLLRTAPNERSFESR